jgi:hypothetical protein
LGDSPRLIAGDRRLIAGDKGLARTVGLDAGMCYFLRYTIGSSQTGVRFPNDLLRKVSSDELEKLSAAEDAVRSGQENFPGLRLLSNEAWITADTGYQATGTGNLTDSKGSRTAAFSIPVYWRVLRSGSLWYRHGGILRERHQLASGDDAG